MHTKTIRMSGQELYEPTARAHARQLTQLRVPP